MIGGFELERWLLDFDTVIDLGFSVAVPDAASCVGRRLALEVHRIVKRAVVEVDSAGDGGDVEEDIDQLLCRTAAVEATGSGVVRWPNARLLTSDFKPANARETVRGARLRLRLVPAAGAVDVPTVALGEATMDCAALMAAPNRCAALTPSRAGAVTLERVSMVRAPRRSVFVTATIAEGGGGRTESVDDDAARHAYARAHRDVAAAEGSAAPSASPDDDGATTAPTAVAANRMVLLATLAPALVVLTVAAAGFAVAAPCAACVLLLSATAEESSSLVNASAPPGGPTAVRQRDGEGESGTSAAAAARRARALLRSGLPEVRRAPAMTAFDIPHPPMWELFTPRTLSDPLSHLIILIIGSVLIKVIGTEVGILAITIAIVAASLYAANDVERNSLGGRWNYHVAHERKAMGTRLETVHWLNAIVTAPYCAGGARAFARAVALVQSGASAADAAEARDVVFERMGRSAPRLANVRCAVTQAGDGHALCELHLNAMWIDRAARVRASVVQRTPAQQERYAVEARNIVVLCPLLARLRVGHGKQREVDEETTPPPMRLECCLEDFPLMRATIVRLNGDGGIDADAAAAADGAELGDPALFAQLASFVARRCEEYVFPLIAPLATAGPHSRLRAGADDDSEMNLELAAYKLPYVNVSGCDAYYTLSYIGPQQRRAKTPLYCSGTLKATIEPKWPPMSMKLLRLCDLDYDAPLRIDVVSAARGGGVATRDDDVAVGSAILSLRWLLDNAGARIALKLKSKERGFLRIMQCEVVHPNRPLSKAERRAKAELEMKRKERLGLGVSKRKILVVDEPGEKNGDIHLG